jgi:hypothetical protein
MRWNIYFLSVISYIIRILRYVGTDVLETGIALILRVVNNNMCVMKMSIQANFELYCVTQFSLFGTFFFFSKIQAV